MVSITAKKWSGQKINREKRKVDKKNLCLHEIIPPKPRNAKDLGAGVSEHTPLGRIETEGGERALLAQRLDLVDELVAAIVARAGQTWRASERWRE